MYIVWDRKIDFLKEVLAAPLNRSTVFLGKCLGGVTDSMIQVTIIIVLGLFIFPEIDYDKIDVIRGLNISIFTSAKNDSDARSLLLGFNFPLRG